MKCFGLDPSPPHTINSYMGRNQSRMVSCDLGVPLKGCAQAQGVVSRLWCVKTISYATHSQRQFSREDLHVGSRRRGSYSLVPVCTL